MEKKRFYIKNGSENIPAVLWGNPRGKLIIEVHGNLSNKEDTVISMMARQAVRTGYQALSFDLPMHGERTNPEYPCIPQNCISDLLSVYRYAKTLAPEIYLFACSMGAYFSLLAYHNLSIRKCLFLSPLVNMERLIRSMMDYFGVSEERLQIERHIELPKGAYLDWDYYCFAKNNPVPCSWNSPIKILYGLNDNITGLKEITEFGMRFNAKVDIYKHGRHYFQSDEELRVFDKWAEKNLI